MITKLSLLLLYFVASTALVAQQCAAQDFDFFYFVLQWPGSYCDTKSSCCYPTTGKPAADFGIHGLWPNYKDGSYPSNCDPDSDYDPSEISDIRRTMETEWPTLACPSGNGDKFWGHEWEKHGTCSETVLNQHQYFQKALDLKNQINVLQALQSAAIKPDGGFYNRNKITEAIKRNVGVTAGLECNVDESGNSQLYQIYFCVDNTATEVIDCPLLPRSRCSSNSIEFPAF